MSFNQGCSSCSWGSSCGASSRGFVANQICHCGEVAVLRVARTVKNEGKQFWGCPNYKRTRNEEFQGCNFFKWRNEDNVDDGGSIIAWQRRKINSLEKSLRVVKKGEDVVRDGMFDGVDEHHRCMYFV
ncbi:hypothetical protein VIGAN_06136900 [Vigna angularis var. angularis]|uniref:GRF-type domain-containing protein n=1 Tax=Vigna angularis var. angularis TaxID=157739 RepID=A0A0S3SBJ2_PHAAN|nr:uncharacterized protein LOC128196528 [Vigna angularis]XP_052733788.1 uncharacterized protein LOC128196528 [Vigna angularis]BAT90178.1 hypothetical protein VIGAN_06136900 [Vigna angularis var. angularis]